MTETEETRREAARSRANERRKKGHEHVIHERPIPPAAYLAGLVRDGVDLVELAARYNRPAGDISSKMQEAGYSPNTGNRCRPYVPSKPDQPLVASAGGSAHYVGGTDYPVETLPGVAPVRWTGIKQPRFTGLDWEAISPPPEERAAKPAPARHRRTSPARSRLTTVRDTQGRPVTTEAARALRRRRRGPEHKLTDIERAEVVKRYVDGKESSVTLAEEYDVTGPTITNAVRAAGLPVRTRAESAALYWEGREFDRPKRQKLP